MKQLWIFIIFVALISCSKEKDLLSTPETFEVSFNVSSLDVEVEPMGRSGVQAKDVLTHINYIIKDKVSGKIYSGSQQKANNPAEFGTIKLWLAAGTYSVNFMGYGVNNPDGNVMMYEDSEYHTINISLNNKDTFTLNDEIKVTKESSSFEINLKRLNGALVVRLSDEIPGDISKMKIDLKYLPLWIVDENKATFEGLYGQYATFSDYVKVTDSSLPEFVFYILPQEARSITLTLYDEFSKEIGATTVNVPFYRNKKSIIQGNILDVITQKPLDVTVTDEWGEDVIFPLN